LRRAACQADGIDGVGKSGVGSGEWVPGLSTDSSPGSVRAVGNDKVIQAVVVKVRNEPS
jgi:hypothetical protein